MSGNEQFAGVAARPQSLRVVDPRAGKLDLHGPREALFAHPWHGLSPPGGTGGVQVRLLRGGVWRTRH